MAEQVIDALLVTLGLDSSQYTEAQKKAAQAILDTRTTVEESASSMASTLTGFAGKLTAFFLGFEGLKGVIDLVKNTAEEFKQLGITAEVMGTSLREVRTLEEFSKLAGGTGSDVTSFAQSRREQMAALVFGRMPPWALPSLVGLNPLTLPSDPMQQLRTIQQAVLSHGGQLQRMLSGVLPGISSQVAQALFLQSMGFSPAMQADLTNPQHFQQDMTKAQRTNKSVQDSQAEAARRAVNAMIDLKTRVENVAGPAGFGLLTSATNLLGMAFTDVTKLFSDFTNSPIGQFLKNLISTSAPPAVRGALKVGQAVEDYTKNLYGKWLPAGWHWLSGIWNPAARSDVQDTLRAQGFLPPASLSAMGIPSQASLQSVLPSIRFPGASGAAQGIGAPTASLIGPGGQGGTNNAFSIGSIQVNTAATDAAGIAADMKSSIQRKFSVTQADTGVVV